MNFLQVFFFMGWWRRCAAGARLDLGVVIIAAAVIPVVFGSVPSTICAVLVQLSLFRNSDPLVQSHSEYSSRPPENLRRSTGSFFA